MPRRNTHPPVLDLPPRPQSSTSPATSTSTSSSPPAPAKGLPQFLALRENPLLQLPILDTGLPTADFSPAIVSQSVPCPPTVIKLGLVTPDTPGFPFQREVQNIRREETQATMDSHIPTPTLTNSPGSPLEMEYSLEEFERYLPLSNLPTPPLSEMSSPELLVELNFQDTLNPELYGPASYLTSMLPKNAARETPSVRLVQSILQRANVSMEVVGLASCILDCLSSRFARRWRAECRLEEGPLERCEVLGVAALSIALKFLEDTSFSTRMWAHDICGDRFSPLVLSFTERLILKDTNFCLARVCTAELIEYSITEMKRYSKPAPRTERPSCPAKTDTSPSKQFGKTTFPRLSELDTLITDDALVPLSGIE